MQESIGHFQDIQYRNVISKYERVNFATIGQDIETFLKAIVEAGYTPTDLFFYSINSPVGNAQDVLVEFFVPVEEDYRKGALDKEFFYHSWFQVLDMAATRVEGDSLEAMQAGIERLEDYFDSLKPKGLLKLFKYPPLYEERTPPFFLTRRDGDKVYTDIMVGMRKNERD